MGEWRGGAGKSIRVEGAWLSYYHSMVHGRDCAMRTLIVLAVAGLVGVVSPGCIIVKRTESHRVALPEGRYTGALRAARTVSYSSDRAAAYKAVACKADIEECDQQRLVYILSDDDDTFSSDKVDVVLTLLNNPAATPRTRSLVGAHAEELAEYSSDRAKIAEALTR
jgi:hypothetical protein